MIALLLVGGLATRLRPLSLRRPKCLFPLNNKPIIDYILENLSKSGCTEAVLAVNNLAAEIQDYLGDEKFGIKLYYSEEVIPLGTGGPIRLAKRFLKDEDFLVLNGDILSFIDYKELFEKHVNGGGLATITLKQVEDPSRFGVVRFGENDSILEFIEKPSVDLAPSNWINAGCYVLDPSVIDLIPEEKVSLERLVFPLLAKRNQLKGYFYWGDWIDIGLPKDYLAADKLLRGLNNNSIHYTSHIPDSSFVKNSIIWENVCVGERAIIKNSVICCNCRIGDDVVVKGAFVGDNVRICDGVSIESETRIDSDIFVTSR